MKNLFVFLIFSGTLPAISQTATAQRSLNAIRTMEESKPLKFIEGIEIRNEGLTITTPHEPAPVKPHSRGYLSNTGTASHISLEKSTSLQFKYAQLLNKEVESINNLALFNFIEEWWETRYRYGGSSRSGIDCSAFTGLLQHTVYGNHLPRTAREQYQACDKISPDELKEGDLLFFNTRGGISHVGVYLSDGYFVHSSTSQGVTINHLEEDYYRARFKVAGRVTRPEDEGADCASN